MEQGYTYIDVKPLIPASEQEDGIFVQDDVLFDWTEVRIPAGVGRLVGLSVLMRGANGASRRPAFDVYFSKSATFSLGNPNDAVDMQPNNDLLGAASVLNGHYMNGLNHMEVANMTTSNRVNIPSTQETGAPGTAGNHRIYVAGVAQSNFLFSTAVETTTSFDVSAIASTSIGSLDNGSGGAAACLDKFAPGDILHMEDDIILGEVATVAASTLTFRHDGVKQYSNGGLVLYDTPATFAAWQIQNGAGAAGDIAANEEIYNIHPITLKLSFAYHD